MPDDLEAYGVGPTAELQLRVSAAALVSVTFPHPQTGQMMLALERKATAEPSGDPAGAIRVIAQPFGGSARILQPHVLQERTGGFHYDSPRSRDEQDFRILIRPADWGAVRQCCLDAFRAAGDGWLEADPARELAEEFADTLRAALSPAQYRLHAAGLLVENEPVATENLRALRLPTARIYAVYEAALVDPVLIRSIMESSAAVTGAMLAEEARRNGRANAALALPVDRLVQAYLGLPPERRGEPVTFEGHRLEGNVAAVLGEVDVPRYERVGM